MQKNNKKIKLFVCLMVLVCLFQGVPVQTYAQNRLNVQTSMISPLSLFELIKKQNINTQGQEELFWQTRILDMFLTDTATQSCVFKRKMTPVFGEAEKQILGHSVVFGGLPVVDNQRAYLEASVFGKRARIFFFKDRDDVKIDSSLGIYTEQDLQIARKRKYWVKFDQYSGSPYGKISLTHKGTEKDPLKVVLVMPRSEFQEAKPTRLPAGLMHIASCLKSKKYLNQFVSRIQKLGVDIEEDIPNIEVHIIDLQAEQPYFDLAAKLEEIQPDVVGVTSVTPLFDNACDIAKVAEKVVPQAVRIIGGVHISAIAKDRKALDKTMLNSEFQVAVLGEGEETLTELILKLLHKKDVTDIPNTAIKEYLGEEPFMVVPDSLRGLEPLISLEEQPLAAEAMDLLNWEGYESVTNVNGKKLGVMGVIFSSRGCPFGCSFCASKAVFHRRIRILSAERVFEEMKYYYERGVKGFYIMDDNFCLSAKRIKKLADLIEASGMDIEYSMMARADSITKELAIDLKRAKCRVAAIGVESGDEEVLKRIDKKTNVRDIEKATRLLQEQGIHVKHFLMVGLPGQDWKSIQKTADLLIKAKPDSINVSVTIPYPGSKLFDSKEVHIEDVELHKLIHEPEPQVKNTENVDVITSTDDMSSSDIARARMLLLELFKNLDKPEKRAQVMAEIDERSKGVLSLGSLIQRIISDNIVFNNLYTIGMSESACLKREEIALLVSVGILVPVDRKAELFMFSDIFPNSRSSIKKFLQYFIKQENDRNGDVFNLRSSEDKAQVLKVSNLVRIYASHFLLELAKQQKEECCHVVLWEGYASLMQEGLVCRLEKKTKGRKIQVSFDGIESIVSQAEDAAAANKKQVFVLPYTMLSSQQKKRLEKIEANIIYADISDDFSCVYSLNLIEGLITAGYAFLFDNEDVLYNAYALLTGHRSLDYVSLEQLKRDPTLFVTVLRFVIEPINTDNLARLVHEHKLLEKLLMSA